MLLIGGGRKLKLRGLRLRGADERQTRRRRKAKQEKKKKGKKNMTRIRKADVFGERGKERESMPELLKQTCCLEYSLRREETGAEHRAVAGSLISHPLSPATKARQVENETA